MAISDTIFGGLLNRGFSPAQAAALTGNIQQESGFDPTNVNTKEGAHGLLQWRGDRWQALQDFAKQRGASPTDVNTQLDFIGQEMMGPEAKNAAPFLAANDLSGANAALKGYIRYGDASQPTRLKYAQAFMPAVGGAPPLPPPIEVGSAPRIASPQQAAPQQVAQATQLPLGAPQQAQDASPGAASFPEMPPLSAPQLQSPAIQQALRQFNMLRAFQKIPTPAGFKGFSYT